MQRLGKSTGQADGELPIPEARTSHIRVAVRCRPLLREESNHERSSVQVDPNSATVTIVSSGSQSGKDVTRMFCFDHVFDTGVSQDEFYAGARVDEMVDAVLAGYHATIFAYGQTGSGKTYTMEGYEYMRQGGAGEAPSVNLHTNKERLGLIPRALAYLFHKVQAANDNHRAGYRYQVHCSYVQIYKEQVYDLLNPNILYKVPDTHEVPDDERQRHIPTQGLRMRWGRREGFYLENVYKFECGSAEQALQLFRAGVANKIMASHRMNMASSRSHALFILEVDSNNTACPEDVKRSKLSLVDLAGSERASLVGASSSATLQQESIFINKSLFTLRKVISALAESPAKLAHVPYRDSKLTSLLKSSLGGTAMTLMVACVAPSDKYFEDNLSTLEYGSKAKNISNTLVVNEDPKSRLIRELRARVKFLEGQLAAQQTLYVLHPGGGDLAGTTPQSSAGAWSPDSQEARATTGRIPSDAFHVQGDRSTSPEEAGGRRLGSGAPMSHSEGASQIEDSKIGRRLIDSVVFIKELVARNEQLRRSVRSVAEQNEELAAQSDVLARENQDLRDRLSFVEGVILMDEGGAGQPDRGARTETHSPAEGAAHAGNGNAKGQLQNVHTADRAVLLEVLELRTENKALQARVEQLEARLLVRDLQQQVLEETSSAAARLPPKGRASSSGTGAAAQRASVQSQGGTPGVVRKTGRKTVSRDSSRLHKGVAPVITGMLSLEDLKGVLLGTSNTRVGPTTKVAPAAAVASHTARLASRHGTPDASTGPSLPVAPRRPSSAMDDLLASRSLRISTTGKLLGSGFSLPAMEAAPVERASFAGGGEVLGNEAASQLTRSQDQGAPMPGDTAYTMGQLGELMRQRNELSRTHIRHL